MTKLNFALDLCLLLRAETNPPLGRYVVLLTLAELGGKGCSADLAARIGGTDQFNSTLTTSERRGYVRGQRRADGPILWHLTPAGEEIVARLLRGAPRPAAAPDSPSSPQL